MAIVRNIIGILHIAWYDSIENKRHSKSTGLKSNSSNLRIAKRYAEKLQDELTKRNNEAKELGIKIVSIKEAFEHFLRNNQNKSPITIYEYQKFFKYFTKSFAEHLPCATITKISVENWIIEIKRLPMQKNSIHCIGKQCIHFLNFLFEYNYLPFFKVNKEVRTRPEVKEKIVFSDEDIGKIFQNLDNCNENLKILINLAFYTGLRSSDMLTITAERVDLDRKLFGYYSPKRRIFREIPFHPELLPILKKRMEEIGTGKLLNFNRTQHLGKAITRYLKEIDLDKKGYTARTFRKTFITLLRRDFKVDAAVVEELVGHEHQTTADRHYNLVSIDSMREALSLFKRPRAN